jgi:hypothetical protein
VQYAQVLGAHPEHIRYDSPGDTDIIIEEYAPVSPNGAIPQQFPAVPGDAPAPHIWNLTQETPSGTIQVQLDPCE